VLQEALEPLLLEVEIQLRKCVCLERTGTSSKRLQEKVEEDLCQHLPLLVQPPVEEPQPAPSAAAATGRRASFSPCGSAGVWGWRSGTGAGHASGSRRCGDDRAGQGRVGRRDWIERERERAWGNKP
jgi:hypothetical protein